jgi:DNA helicase HerA-like ATPase
VIFDVHGEYSGMASAFRDQVKVVRAESVRIAVSEMTIWHFKEFLPEMSGSQARDLSQILAELRSQSRAFGIEEVIERLRESERVNRNLRAALEGWLFDLQALGVFGRDGWPRWEDVVAPGTAVIVDMERITSLTKKQILLAYIADRLFLLRRRGLIPPTVLVIEEAHTFAPTESAISKHILETIAREGRKFFMSLVVISQRPVRLSATLLSQTNTNIILRITNPYDLEHIKKSSEMVTGEMTDAISSLAVGEALVVGEAVNFPVFVRVRKSITSDRFESSFEEAARLYELSTRPGSWSTETSEQSSSLRMDSGESTRSSTYSSITGERST